MTIESPGVRLEPALVAAGDEAQFWRVPRYDGLECLRATFRRYAYVRHTHETYAIAAVLRGCETFYHRGQQRYVPAGSLAVVCPDELHDGAPFGGGFVYRTIYPTAALMQDIAEDVAGRPLRRAPHFPCSVIDDPALTGSLARLHASLRPDATGIPALERDARLVGFLTALITRWADLDAPLDVAAGSPGILRAREFLDANYAEEVGLGDLARVAGLSRAHLIRAFSRETGLTPHAYLVDRRFRAARRELERGEPPGAVAAACGFFDQSHLTRVFKARMGVTPGVYRSG
jgi:AraC-like DNA-binding protein